jgi:hypothetical protein
MRCVTLTQRIVVFRLLSDEWIIANQEVYGGFSMLPTRQR